MPLHPITRKDDEYSIPLLRRLLNQVQGGKVMRLTNEEIQVIKDVVAQVVPGAEVYLFGSRADDTKRGGDIDLLIYGRSEKSLAQVSRIRILLQEKLGDQKIDIVYQRLGTDDTFTDLVCEDAVKL